MTEEINRVLTKRKQAKTSLRYLQMLLGAKKPITQVVVGKASGK